MARRYAVLNLLLWMIPNASIEITTVQKKAMCFLCFHESKSIVTVPRRFRL
ncbi:hypothetical protein AVEN_22244-1, partial [Araneus ventricosus]